MKRLALAGLLALSLTAVCQAADPYTYALMRQMNQNNARVNGTIYGLSHGAYATPQFYGRYGSYPTASGAGGFIGPWGYMPYSYSVTPTYGGALYQGYGGSFGPGFYQPYSYGGFAPNYGYGFGVY
jgi:hypothetical protein